MAEKDGGKHIKVKERLTNETVSGVGAHGQRTYRIDFLIPQTVPVYNFTSCCLIKQYFIIAVSINNNTNKNYNNSGLPGRLKDA